MVARIAVVDPLPLFRQGVASVLSAAGHSVETPTDVSLWLRRAKSSVVLLTVRSERDWDLLDRLCGAAGHHLVIAVLDAESAVLGARAVRTGARSVLARDVAADTLRQTVEATIGGQAVMPADVAAALAGGTPPNGQRALSAEQLSWLRQLASGSTVTQMADRAGYSERAMFRLLQAVYRQMGVRTRLEAIMRAQESGWL
ncbi:response regulator transcription factor [Actinosynnema sp. NPDC047251]|uniref:response regulator transcription factor n=1 Tax=Saccharothrix espanaensis TaxID=103731 RepID=UPI0002E0C144|nr:response regulator transcription factor [Saccharothrix espanaensis]